MPIISKYLRNAKCSEFIHPWCNSCLETFWIMWKIGFKESVKVYAAFYTLSSLVTLRKLDYYHSRFPFDILRSSLFLSLNGALFSIFICSLRYFLKFNALSIAYIPSFIASMISVSFERKSRRQQLAVYMINIAFQTVYLMLKSRGYVSGIKDGEVLLFSFAAAGMLYLFVQKKTPGYITKFLGYLFGYSEIQNYNSNLVTIPNVGRLSHINVQSIKLKLSSILDKLMLLFHDKFKLAYKTGFCNHSYSCIQYVVSGFFKPFIVGVTIENGLNLLKYAKFPRKLLTKFTQLSSYQLGLFLGVFSIVFRALQCTQRHLFIKSRPIFVLISGFVAGLSNKLYPSVAISMYTIIKLAELCLKPYYGAISETYYSKLVILIYSIATAVVFNAAILEPGNVPRTYINFLNKLTSNRLNHVDRRYLKE